MRSRNSESVVFLYDAVNDDLEFINLFLDGCC